MTKGTEIKQTRDLPLEAAQPGSVQVTQGNVSIVTVQLLNDISIKLSKIITLLESK